MNTKQAHGHWSDRFTKDELIAAVIEIGTRRNPTLMKDVAYVLGGGSVEADAGTLSDEVAGYAHQIARRTGAYDDVAILGDVADALQEMEEEYATNMNLPAPRYTEQEQRLFGDLIAKGLYTRTGCRNPTDSGERCGFCAYCLTVRQPAEGSLEDPFLIRAHVIAEDRKHASEQDRQHDSTCEHGHPNCNPTSDKCGDECD